MAVADLEEYEEFKTAILKWKELRQKAYSFQYRGVRKRPADTFIACTC